MKRALLPCVVIAVTLSGCGDDDGSSPGGSGPSGARPAGVSVAVSADPSSVSVTGGGSSAEPTVGPVATEPPAATLDPAYVHVDVGPGLGTDEFVGAREDVHLDRCELDGDHWVAAGTVTNSSGAGAAYRIYVAFNPPDSPAARGLVQVEFLVPQGETKVWEAVAWIADPALECVLQVERISG
jgi:hypothetical protein